MRRPFGLHRRFFGRRLGDPVDRPVGPDTRAVRGRLAAVSVRASIAAGAWVGFAIGLVLGAGLGAVIVWFSGAIVDWQRDLAFTFGVARQLLPFGDQQGLLRDISGRWWLVVPVVSLVIALVAAAVGALLGGVLAAAYNRSPRHATVIVELPKEPRSFHRPEPRLEPAREEARPEVSVPPLVDRRTEAPAESRHETPAAAEAHPAIRPESG